MGFLSSSAYGRRKGESGDRHNARLHRAHKEGAIQAKKDAGKWLPKAEYERRTGRPGRAD